MTREVICRAEFNYVNGQENCPVESDILNGRRYRNPGWQTCGFELKSHLSAVTDWDDDAQIRRVHYEEMAKYARELCGSDFALVGSHIKRNPEQAKVHADLAPITFVHSDFAESYGDLMRSYYAGDNEEVRNSLEIAGIKATDVARAKRMVILQFWRNLGAEKMDLPIAFCDAQNVTRDEMLTILVSDYAGGGFDFETLGVQAPKDDHHKWYFFPEMKKDEVVVFRTFDSECVGKDKPFWTPHSAFRDPDVPLGRPGRESIELRATCLFY